MILADSNVLIYSINIASPKHKAAQEFIRKNINTLCVAQQNIFESLRVLTHPKYPNPMTTIAAIRAVALITDNLKIIVPSYETGFVAIEMAKSYQVPGDRIFDIYLAATMLTNDIETIATDNEKDFLALKEVRVLNPFRK